MSWSQLLNLTGLLCITAGSIAAARGAPSPKYAPDGSVGLAAELDKERRIVTYWWQKNFRNFLLVVALGAVLQAIALFIPSGQSDHISQTVAARKLTAPAAGCIKR